jgi:hypothetical protein
MEIFLVSTPTWAICFVGCLIYSYKTKRLVAYLKQLLVSTYLFAVIAILCFPMFGTLFDFTSYSVVTMLFSAGLFDWVRNIGENK